MNNRETVEKVNEAFAKNRIDDFLELCSDDITWTMVGKPAVTGKPALKEMMSDDTWTPPEFSVSFIIADADRAACEGHMKMAKKDGSEEYAGFFCDLYRFRDGKVCEMRSYFSSGAFQQ